MNVDRSSQGLTVLLVLACAVVHTSCRKVETNVTHGTGSKTNIGNDAKNGRQSDSELEKMLLNVATIIQKCIDEETMNNKDFKIKLDKLYKNVIKSRIQEAITKNMPRFNRIKELYEDRRLMLIIMNSDKENKKN